MVVEEGSSAEVEASPVVRQGYAMDVRGWSGHRDISDRLKIVTALEGAQLHGVM